MNNLPQRTDEAYDQLIRYGGAPFSETIVDILEVLTDINDDLWHSRLKSLTEENAIKIKALLDKLLQETDE